MDKRRAYLKELAARSARRWSSAPLAPAFAGETRIETRNTVYQLRDGVCYLVTRREGASPARLDPSAFVGMRVVGWLMRDYPQSGLSADWRPGAYAVMWRPREPGEEHSAVALTSSSLAFRVVARTVPPPAPVSTKAPPTVRSARISTPPPLPLALPRGSSFGRPLTPGAFAPSPPSLVPPPPPSMTRLHMRDDDVPPAPDTPTPPQPQRRSSVPPPLPAQARGIKPLPPRALAN